ncbi:hypothetical protein P7K49_016591 [Saguinus oedipus]|uniref:Uncharacterized protein n=1 Tax=Saguinus oedipus TaxID=9490 RepID=A0ABQ9VFF6_SAGOE|nr:hypothetical protein P7K49_016591 [Saguinus oedipus]
MRMTEACLTTCFMVSKLRDKHRNPADEHLSLIIKVDSPALEKQLNLWSRAYHFSFRIKPFHPQLQGCPLQEQKHAKITESCQTEKLATWWGPTSHSKEMNHKASGLRRIAVERYPLRQKDTAVMSTSLHKTC